MPSILNPDTLKAVRNEKNLSRAELAEKCGCTLETVGRWERGKAKATQQRLKDALCEALDVPWEALCRPHQPKSTIKPGAPDDGRQERVRPLNARVSHRAHLAFTLASQRYGVRIADIVELAPLLFMVAAEQSLADRQKKVDALGDAFDTLEAKRDDLRQINARILFPDICEITEGEAASIARREVFGCDHWESWNWNDDKLDPFVNYLRTTIEAAGLSPGLIESIHSESPRAPSCRLGIEAIKAISGLTEDTEDERTALAYIEDGRLDVRDLLDKRKLLSADDFREWFAGWVASYDDTQLD
jgi:transcriptional regulator with XRE-family HTH domain